jgi:hypothetical protein
MKKLAVVALALVIAMSFVGCGLANQLEGTKWEYKVTAEDSGVKVSSVLAWEFKADNVFVESMSFEFDIPAEYKDFIDEEDLAYAYPSTSVTGTWSVDGGELIISGYAPLTAEIDGDTSEISEFDQWFMGSETGNLYIHVVAAGEAICAKDKNDEPQLTMMNEQGIQALTDAVEFYLGGQVLVANLQKFYDKYPGPGEAYEKTVTNAFLEGRELFYMSTLIHIPYFRQMNDEFGILPVPMYSESQDNYYSAMSAHTSSVLMIPNGVNADGAAGEDLGLIIQALAELSQELLTPEYYDKQLKFRDFKDEETSDMLDIIFNNRHYDLGTIFGQTWNNVDTLYGELNTDIVSRFQQVQDVVSELIKDTMDDIRG